jgi:hypothetical protein
VTSINWSSIKPGNIICIAGGNYGTMNIQSSGTANARIYIQRATAGDSACGSTSVGWSSVYDSQPILVGINVTGSGGSYVTVDGKIPYTGIQIHNSSMSGDTYLVLDDNGANYFEIVNVDMAGAPTCDTSYPVGHDYYSFYANYGGTATGLHIAYSALHNNTTAILLLGQSNALIEHNKLHTICISNILQVHPNVFEGYTRTSNITFRYNEIYDWQNEGIMLRPDSSVGPNGTYYIYGNLWHDGWAVARIIESQHGSNGPVYLYDNTFVNIPSGIALSNNGVWDSSSSAQNNLFYNVPSGGFSTGNDSNNLLAPLSSAFVNYSNHDYHIVGTTASGYPSNAGVNLGSPYNLDLDGKARPTNGAWDIGAYQY